MTAKSYIYISKQTVERGGPGFDENQTGSVMSERLRTSAGTGHPWEQPPIDVKQEKQQNKIKRVSTGTNIWV
jgi:hypothetical protein